MPFVSSRGANIYYEVHGAGPTVIFSHGLGGHTLFYYQQVPFFARSYRVILFDHRGFGRSVCPMELVHPQFFVDDLAAVLDRERVNRAAIVCQSMGGLAGLPFALRAPHRVAALVLASSPGGIQTEKANRDFAASVPKRRSPGFTLWAPSFSDRFPERAFLHQQLLSLYPSEATDVIVPRLREVYVTPSELRGYSVPTLVIAGSEDPLFSSATLQEIADLIPSASFVQIDGAGHTAYSELPEEFNHVVDRFIRPHLGSCTT
jgi:pimeloyl-ACP methyl ester carboxylesterase